MIYGLFSNQFYFTNYFLNFIFILTIYIIIYFILKIKINNYNKLNKELYKYIIYIINKF